jgi:hypothetical protein
MTPHKAHYKVHAYICGQGRIHEPGFEGWALFGDIFQQRPDGCRYGVVEATDHQFEVWDFFADDLVRGEFRNIPPIPIYTGAYLDGLIMKVLALYGKSDDREN